ncbi:MAG: hypothetical protein U0R65_05470 [Candidatus Nanopelagicales bacterium]
MTYAKALQAPHRRRPGARLRDRESRLHLRRARAARVTAATCVVVAVALLIPLLPFGEGWNAVLLLSCFGVVIPLVVAFRTRSWPGDPLVLTALAVLIFFVVRPSIDLLGGDFRWAGIDVSDHYDQALNVTAATVLPYLAVLVLVRRRNAFRRIPAERSLLPVGYWLLAAMAALGAASVVASVVLAGGAAAYFGKRGLGGYENQVAFLAQMVILSLASAVGFFHFVARRRHGVTLAAIASIPVLATVLRGDRRYLVALVVALSLSWLSRRWGTKGVVTRAIVLALVLLVGAVAVEVFRPEASRAAWSAKSSISDAAVGVLTGQSTAMTSAIALGLHDLEAGGQAGFGVGRYTLAETILQPVPRQLLPEKPLSIRTTLIAMRFGVEGWTCRALCPTFTPVVTFVADFGIAGAVLGGSLLGLVVAGWYAWSLASRRASATVAAYCASSFAVFSMWWGSLADLTVAILLGSVPLAVVGLLGTSRSAGERPSE